MLTVICVLRTGSVYGTQWVTKLKRACERHLSVPHKFACLTDTPVEETTCYALEHNWPGWWAKIELFRPGVIQGPTLYLDLDTVLVGSIDRLADFPYDFAMMRNLNNPAMPGSAVMWFREVPTHIYEAFAENPQHYMGEYAKANGGTYIGDQALIWDFMDRKVPFLTDDCPGLIRSYRRHCMAGVPEGCSLVAFGGPAKPSTVRDEWVKEAWNA